MPSAWPTAKPRGNVNVRVIGANGLPVFSARTDARGKAVLPSLAGFTREKKPLALAAAQGSDLAFLPLEQYARKLNYSRFDVGGNRLSDQGINAYLFSQRGMYRPGESLHFGYLVKQGQWGSTELAGLPLRATLYNPRGNKAASKKITLTAEGFGELSFPLEETAPTGPWELRLSTADDGQRGEVLRVSRVMVEEFQPEPSPATTAHAPAPGKGLAAAPGSGTRTGKGSGKRSVRAGKSGQPFRRARCGPRRQTASTLRACGVSLPRICRLQFLQCGPESERPLNGMPVRQTRRPGGRRVRPGSGGLREVHLPIGAPWPKAWTPAAGAASWPTPPCCFRLWNQSWAGAATPT